MPFDLSTAKPVNGFDLSTARPANESEQKPKGEPTALNLPGEAAAGVNRSLLEMAEFIPVTVFNGIAELAGSDMRIPEEYLPSNAFVPQKGDIAGEGLASQIAGTGGETAGMALSAGSIIRGMMSKLPAFTQGESAIIGTLRQFGKPGPGADISFGAASGAGAEVGEEIGGETGKIIGAIAAPLAAAPAAAIAQKLKGGLPVNEVVQAGKQFGVPVKTTDVIPPKNIVGGLARQLGERIPIFGTGGGRAIQQQAREKAVQEVSDKLPIFSADDIVQSLKQQTSKIKRAAGNRLEFTKNQLNTQGEVPRTNLLKQIDESLNRLQSVKIKPDTQTIKEIESIKAGAQSAHTFSELRDARTAVRELAESTDALGRSQMPSKSKAALKAIESSITKDLDDFAKKSLGPRDFSRYKEADQIWSSEATKLTKSKLKNILDKGDITPETVETMLFSRKPSEVQLLYNSLSTPGRSAARSALVQRALAKATKGDEINPTLFANELDRLKGNVGVFFKGDDLKKLTGLRKLLLATKRAQEAGVTTPTGQSLFFITSAGAGSQVGLIPTIAAAATGGSAARVYESAPVRDMLLKMAETPINSQEFGRIAGRFAPSIAALINEEE